MRLFFDENFPMAIARGLHEFQKGRRGNPVDVFHIASEFKRGIPDEEWIPKLAQQHAVVVTQDVSIYRRQAQAELCRKYKLGLVFIKTPKKSGLLYWQMVTLLIKHWEEIVSLSAESERPFAYECAWNKKKINRVEYRFET